MVEPHYVIVQSAGSIPAVLDTTLRILKVQMMYPSLAVGRVHHQLGTHAVNLQYHIFTV